MQQRYNNMNINELANEISKLNDENFCIIIKDLDNIQLKELIGLVGMEKKLRLMQELSLRIETQPGAIAAQAKQIKLQLPLTAEQIAPLPNLILRSNLFSASKTHGAKDEAIRDFEITTYGKDENKKIKVFLTAYRHFNQADLDILLELFILQQKQNNNLLKISGRQLILKTTGYDGKKQYQQVKEQLEILRNANIKIVYNNYTFVGGFLNNAYFDDDEQLYIIEFNSKIAPLFSKNSWTAIDTTIRKQLKTNLAKWLHGFYSSHLNSKMPIKLETIYNLSGASDKDMARWIRIRVVNALENLQSVFLNNNMKFNYRIQDGLLFVNKTHTNSQNKNIKNKITSTTKNKETNRQTLS